MELQDLQERERTNQIQMFFMSSSSFETIIKSVIYLAFILQIFFVSYYVFFSWVWIEFNSCSICASWNIISICQNSKQQSKIVTWKNLLWWLVTKKNNFLCFMNYEFLRTLRDFKNSSENPRSDKRTSINASSKKIMISSTNTIFPTILKES